VITASVVAYGVLGTTDIGDRTVTVTVKPGDSFNRVAGELVEKGVAPSGLWLKLIARFTDIDHKLTPGPYDFTGANSCWSILDDFRHARFVGFKVTIPEGSTIWQTASILSRTLAIDSAAFHNLNSDRAFLEKVKLEYLEGYLFPETYYFPRGISPTEVAEEMVSMFRRQTSSLWHKEAPQSLSPEQVVVLASIVEAEAVVDSERSTIASVYLNRLKIRMKLDADPTVIYGLGGLDRPLYTRDLRTDGPYNTYRRRGLPPTPINSPGLESIKAVLEPAITEYYYFVADNTGRHIFSRTNSEHNTARQKIRRQSNGN